MSFSGEGSGTQKNPYKVTDWGELQELNDYLDDNDVYFELQNDLNSSTSDYDTYASSSANDGDGWDPIGDSSNPFKGVLDGMGYIISDLYISRSSTDYVGLIGNLVDGNVYDFGLTSVDITGNNNTAPLVGEASGDSGITRVFTSGTVSGGDNVGGFIGKNEGLIKGCYSNTTVNGSDGVGGFVGRSLEGVKIEKCYSTGTLTASGENNAFAGYADDFYLSYNYVNTDIVSANVKYAEGLTTSEMTNYENDYPEMYAFYRYPWKTSEVNEDQNSNSGYPALVWENGVTLTVQKEDVGYVFPEVGTTTYNYKEEVTISAQPEGDETTAYIKERLLSSLPNFYNKDNGSVFKRWEGEGFGDYKETFNVEFDIDFESEENEFENEDLTNQIVMDQPKTVTAYFEDVKSNFNMLMEAVGKEIENLMLVYEDILESHYVDEAKFVNLDKIGAMWGLERLPDETDESFRARIKAYAPGFGGGGTLSDLKKVMKWYVGEDKFVIDEFSEDITINRTEESDAGENETWDNGDIINFHYKTSNVTTVDSVEKSNGTSVSYTVDYTEGEITIDENTGERYLYVSYTLDVTQHGRFKVYVDPTTESNLETQVLKDEINKFKAAGILAEFGSFNFPDKEGELILGEDDDIEGHMVNATYVNDANLVLEE